MTRMRLDNGEETKGEVHWIISYDEASDTHYVECPTTPMDIDDDGNVTSGNTWHMSTLFEGDFIDCVEWIYFIAKLDRDGWDGNDFVEVDGFNETRQEDEAGG